MRKSILMTSLTVIVALFCTTCYDSGTDSGSDKWAGDVNRFLRGLDGTPPATPITYDVTWIVNEGAPPPTQTTVNQGGSITAPAAMTRTGYTFDGWYSDNAMTSSVKFPITNVTANTTLYAKWTADLATVTYTVTWNADGGFPVPTLTSVIQGGSISEPNAMTKTGHTFDGWYSNTTMTSLVTFPITNVTGPMTFYAKWTLNSYTVTWIVDGGSPIPTQTTVNHGGSITKPNGMTKTGYAFDGWYSNSALTVAVTFPITNVTANTTLYAKWTLNPGVTTYKVTLLGGGTGATGAGDYAAGDSVAIFAGDAPTGKQFNNWTTASNGVTFVNANSARTKFKMPVNAVTVTANFETQSSASVDSGWFTDSRGGTTKTYKWVKIGGVKWMAENLNYDTLDGTGSWCYNNQDSNCVKYGRLYDWNTAMAVCPSGWRLSDTSDWNKLVSAAGDESATNLKARTGWFYRSGYSIEGTDKFGFSAMPGGQCRGCIEGGDHFMEAGTDGIWWTATVYDYVNTYCTRGMRYDVQFVGSNYANEVNGFSVRCVEN